MRLSPMHRRYRAARGKANFNRMMISERMSWAPWFSWGGHNMWSGKWRGVNAMMDHQS